VKPIPVPRTWQVSIEFRFSDRPAETLTDPAVYAGDVGDVFDSSEALADRLEALVEHIPAEVVTGLTLTVDEIL
jgi:hypothetical protein